MKASWRKGLSGAVSAIVIAVVLVGGLASASYINITTARYNEAQMQEALRQARLGSELIRIHIHSTDGAVDSPPRITFVNAWGYESRIIELVVIARNMTPIATIDLRNRPIVLPPGSRLTLEPSQIGLSYPTFKRMADELRSIHAYTEAGNSFGSTWGFPREHNMAGRTVAVEYSVSTNRVWYVPSFIHNNRTFTASRYITIGDIPETGFVKILARHHYEKARVEVGAELGNWICVRYRVPGNPDSQCLEYAYGRPHISGSVRDSLVEGYPPGAGPEIGVEGGPRGSGWRAPYSVSWGGLYIRGLGRGFDGWRWYPEDGWVTNEGPVMYHEIGSSIYGFNAPNEMLLTVSGDDGVCKAKYVLGRTVITPSQPGFIPVETTFTRTYYPSRYPNSVTQTLQFSVARFFRAEAEANTLQSPVTTTRTIHSLTTVTTSAEGTVITHTYTHGLTTWTTTWTWSRTGHTYTYTYTTVTTVSQTLTVDFEPVDIVVDRYYYVADVKCDTWPPPPPPSTEPPRLEEWTYSWTPGGGGPGPERYCTIRRVESAVPVVREVTQYSGGVAVVNVITEYSIAVRLQTQC
jgi:hypothetical protein